MVSVRVLALGFGFGFRLGLGRSAYKQAFSHNMIVPKVTFLVLKYSETLCVVKLVDWVVTSHIMTVPKLTTLVLK